jgi:O-antigen ligase
MGVGRVIAVGMLVTWAGYGLASYGWNLLKGYDITFVEWFNPVKIYQWNGKPGTVPVGQVFPGGTAVAAAASPTTSTLA